MKALLLLALFVSGLANAQPNLATPSTGLFYGYGPNTTPTMERRRTVQLNALRVEEAGLRAADGGILSREHSNDIRKRVARIVGNRRPSTGSLIERD